MGEIAIRIENVSKEYRLGVIGGGTLRGDLQSWWAKIRNKENPNSKIGASNIYKKDRFKALDGITLDVKQGEALGIIGHNGAGKSTLLKLISRVTAPTEGLIAYNGRIASMLEVGTGFHPELTGRENIYMNGAILGMTKAEIKKKFDEIVEFSEVEKFIDTPVKRYSSGMYVKLAFSVAAHLDAEIMIMDEVLAVGDSAFQQKSLAKMRDAAKRGGKTVLYVSHNMSTISHLCDRCIVLDQGRLKYAGDVQTAINKYIGISAVEYSTYNDFSNKERIKDVGGLIKMLSLTLKNGKDNIFIDERVIKAEILMDSKIDLNGKFMIIFFKIDGTRVAMSESGIFPCKKGINRVAVNIPTDCFPNNDYYIELSVFSCNQKNELQRQDGVQKAMSFRIQNKPVGFLSDNWRYGTWGNMKAKPIQIISVASHKN